MPVKLAVLWPTTSKFSLHRPGNDETVPGNRGGGVLLWVALRFLFQRRGIATILGLVFASHVVLDVIQHEPNIRLVPWRSTPTIGLNLTALPWLDFARRDAFCVACWMYYRGSRKLLAAILALNIANLPLMLAGEGSASPMTQNPFILPAVMLLTILLAWGPDPPLRQAHSHGPTHTCR